MSLSVTGIRRLKMQTLPSDESGTRVWGTLGLDVTYILYPKVVSMHLH